MKSFNLIFGVCLIISLNSCSQDFKKLKESEVDAKKLQSAQKFAVDYLTKQKNGSWYVFTDEATDLFKNQLNEQTQKEVYKQLKDKYGDYHGLEYAETWIQTDNTSIVIFRFKGDFDKSTKKLEIRVVLDGSSKIAGFWIKPWYDMFN
jgi:hypothetical protein